MADFLNSKVGTLNPFVLGPMQVVRANTTFDYGAGYWDEDLMEYVYPEIPGWVACLTEVIEWPFSTDDAGVSFPGGLYGVRTRAWRQPLADGGGDMDWWTAVPRELPAEYQAAGRYSVLVSGFYTDYLGDNPAAGTVWNHRTPTGLLLNSTNDPDGHRALWTPMNLNQQVVEVTISDAFSGQWVPYVDAPFGGTILYWVAALDSQHVGFRGGKLTFTVAATAFGAMPESGSADFEIVAVPLNEFWDPYDCDDSDLPVSLTSGTVSWSFASYADPPVVVDVDLGDMRPPPGIPCRFFIRYPTSGDVPIYQSSHYVRLSPRVDVPLWYSASMGNRVAPGGIIVPP